MARDVDLRLVANIAAKILHNQEVVEKKERQELLRRIIHIEELLFQLLQTPEKRAEKYWLDNEMVCKNRLALTFLRLIPDVYSAQVTKDEMALLAQSLVGPQDAPLCDALARLLLSRLQSLRSNVFRKEEERHGSSLAKKIPEFKLILRGLNFDDGGADAELQAYVIRHLQLHFGLVNNEESRAAFLGKKRHWRAIFQILEGNERWAPGLILHELQIRNPRLQEDNPHDLPNPEQVNDALN